MNNLTETNRIGAELLLGTPVLEGIRNRTELKIVSNPILSEDQIKSALKELDFLIEYERLHRLRQFAFRWIEGKEAFHNELILSRVELANEIRISRKQAALKIAKINREIANCRLDLMERIKKLHPKDDSSLYIKKAHSELQKLRFQKIIMREKEEIFHENLANRTLNRHKFYDKVKKLYPDMVDELMEYYDRQVFQQTARR